MLQLFLSFIFLLPAFSVAAKKLDYPTILTNNSNLTADNTTFFKTNDLPFFNIAQAEVYQNTNHYHCHACQSLPMEKNKKRPFSEVDSGKDSPPKKRRKIMKYLIIDNNKRNENAYLITDKAIDELIDWVAQQVWNRAEKAAHQTVDIDMLYYNYGEYWRYKVYFVGKKNFQLVSIGNVNQLIGAIKELAKIKKPAAVTRWIDWITKDHQAQALKYYKFGDYVVEVETYFYYAELVGRIDGSDLRLYPVPFYYRRPIGQSSKGMIEYMEDYADFQPVVNSWLKNGNPNCDGSTPPQQKQCSYMAQMSIALFLSEPTRNFRVHVTNMMQMHALKHGIDGYNLKRFYDQHPMARGQAWPDRKETGMKYKKSTEAKSSDRHKRKIVEGRIQSIVKSWCPLFNFAHNSHKLRCIIGDQEPSGTIDSDSSTNLFKIWKCYTYALATLGPNVLDTKNDLVTQTIDQCLKY